MGMISDCDELQKNRAQNDPLTVKTPPPPARVPLLPGGRRAAGGGRTVSGGSSGGGAPLLRPSTCHASRYGGEVQQGKKPRKALRVNGSWRMPKRYKFQHSPGEGVALYGRDQAQGGEVGEVGEVGEGVARGSPGAVLLPSCPAPAMLPNAQPVRVLLHDRAGRRVWGVF